MAERGQRPLGACDREESPEPAPGDIFQEHPLDGVIGAERENLVTRRFDQLHCVKSPIDSLEAPRCRSTFVPSPDSTRRPSCFPAIRSVPSTSPTRTSTTSCSETPSAACSATPAPTRGSPSRCRAPAWAARARRSSSRSSIQLGCKKLIRVGTCGGLQPHHQLGDLIVALTAVPADSTAMHLVGGEPHCPTASWSLIHGAVHVAKEIGQELHVGPIVSSDLFYNPDERPVPALVEARRARGRDGGLRPLHRRRDPRRRVRVPADVSDIVVEGEFTRITDDELKAAVDRMTPHRARRRDRRPLAHRHTVFLVNPASDNGSHRAAVAEQLGRTAAEQLGLVGRDAPLATARAADGAGARAVEAARRSSSRSEATAR